MTVFELKTALAEVQDDAQVSVGRRKIIDIVTKISFSAAGKSAMCELVPEVQPRPKKKE